MNWNIFNIRNQQQLPTFSNHEAERQARLCQYQRVWEAYLAELPDPLITEKGAVNDNVKINPSRAIIDVGTYFLFGRPINFHIHPEESTGSGSSKAPKAGSKPQAKQPPKQPSNSQQPNQPQDNHSNASGGGNQTNNNLQGQDQNRNQAQGQDRNQNQDQQNQNSQDNQNQNKNQDQQNSQDNNQGDSSGYTDHAHGSDNRPNPHQPLHSDQHDSSSSDQHGAPTQHGARGQAQSNAIQSHAANSGGNDSKGGFPQKKGSGNDPQQQGDSNPNAPQVPEQPVDPPWMKTLNRAWKANSQHLFLMKLGKSGAIHGDVFVKMIPNGAGTMNQYPRLILLDPANVDVYTDPNDVEKVIEYQIAYIVEDIENNYTKPVRRVQRITQAEDGQSWVIRDFEQRMTFENNVGWTPGNNPELQVGQDQVWDYPWPPIEHCQNLPLPHLFWGMPDLDDSSVDVLQSLQRAMSTLNKIVRIHSSPRLFAKNVMPDMLSEIDISPENIIALPQMDAELSVLTVLDNLSSALEFTKQIKSDLLEMVRVPAIALGHVEDAASAASGINMSVLYSPLIQKTEEKQITYGDLLIRLSQKMLVLMGEKFTPEMEDLCVEWPESMPGSKYLERQTLQQDQQMGVSQYTIVKRLGYNPDEEQARNEQVKQQETQMQMQVNSARFGDQMAQRQIDEQQRGPGGNNNPAGMGNKNGSMGAANKNTPKKQQF